MLEILLEVICSWLPGLIVASDRRADLEKSHTLLIQEIVMHVQNDLQTALLATPAEYEALRKEYGQYIIIPEQYAALMLENWKMLKK